MHYFTDQKKNLFLILTFLLLFSPNVRSQSGSVHYWMLEESSPPFRDFNSSLGASSINTPQRVLGTVGFAQKFDSLSKVFVPDDGSFNWSSTQSFSIEFWMKDSSTSTQENEVLIGRDDPGTADGSNLHWWVGLEAGTGFPVFLLRDNHRLGAGISGLTSVTDGRWHHFAAVRDNSLKSNYLYIDDQLAAQTTFDYLNDFSAFNLQVNIGYLPDPMTNDYHYNGILDEIAVYNRALSASEVNKHYNDGLNKIGYNGKIIEFLAENGRTDNTKFKFDIFVRNVALKDTSGFKDYLGDCLLSFSRNAAALGTDVSISATGPNFGSSSYDFSAQVNAKGNIELLIDFKNTGSGIPLPLSAKEFLCTVELTLLDSAANTNINWIPENLIIATGDFLRIPAYLNDLESVPLSAGFVSGEALTFQLEQNYPNPFNPSTTIRFAVPQAGKVTLSVYNVLGEKIRDLISGFYETGIHSVNFDGKDLNSGVYIYKLQSENFVKVKKMLLMK